MAHYEMKWNGKVYEVSKDGVFVSEGRDYIKIFDGLLAQAEDTDTFSDGNGVVTYAEIRVERAIQEARFKEE